MINKIIFKTSNQKLIATTFISTLIMGQISCGGGGGGGLAAAPENSDTSAETSTTGGETDTVTSDSPFLVHDAVHGGLTVRLTSSEAPYGAVVGAEVKLNIENGTNVTVGTTDANGEFVFEDMIANRFYTLEINHDDYVVRSYPLTDSLAGEENTTVEVTLLPVADPVQFDEDVGGSVFASGAEIILPENAFVTPSGDPVSGTVTVYATPIDPTIDEHMDAYPGTLMATAEDGTQIQLHTYGVFDIDFYDDDGNYLQLAERVQAELVLPVLGTTHDDGSAVQAGDKIPLWHLNESTGIWEPESTGVVELNDDGVLVVRGKVSHFSAYNMDRGTNFSLRYWNTININAKDPLDTEITLDNINENELPSCLAVKHYHTDYHGNRKNFDYSHDVICVDDTDYKQDYYLRPGWLKGYCWEVQVLKPGVTDFNWSNQNTLTSAGTQTFCHEDTHETDDCDGKGLSGNSVDDARHCGTLSDHIGFDVTFELQIDEEEVTASVSLESLAEGKRLDHPEVAPYR